MLDWRLFSRIVFVMASTSRLRRFLRPALFVFVAAGLMIGVAIFWLNWDGRFEMHNRSFDFIVLRYDDGVFLGVKGFGYGANISADTEGFHSGFHHKPHKKQVPD